MTQQELLKKLAACPEVSGMPYMMTGSLVSSLHGEPRSTHDIDVIVCDACYGRISPQGLD